MRPPQLLTDLEGLRSLRDPATRGHQFEVLVARALRSAHFTVEENPGTARPRRSDILARGRDRDYLVEVKWYSHPADVSDVDALRSRTERATANVVGVLVSMSGFTQPAIEAAQARRERVTLLVAGEDFESVAAGETDFHRLLGRKYDDFVVHGRATTVAAPSKAKGSSARAAKMMPLDERAFVLQGEETALITAGGDFGAATFALSIPDIDWIAGGGMGTTLDIPLACEDTGALIGIFAELASIGWATGSATWGMQQSTTNWHGFGATSCVRAIESWASRYEQLSEFHHTEQICFMDTCDGGFFTLVADIAASEHRRVRHGNLSFQLTGVPLDVGRYARLCEVLDVEPSSVSFRPREERSLVIQHLSTHEPPITVAVRGLVVETNDDEPDDWVVGVVVDNPFLGGNLATEWLPAAIAQSEVLVCDLRSSHPVASPRSYVLTRCEWAWTSDALVFRPTVDRADVALLPDG